MESLVEKLTASLGIESTASLVIISIAIILFGGFLMTRLTKLLKLPNVTAYIITGILLVPIWTVIPGSNISGIIPTKVVDGMDFLSDIALAFIAFGAGEFFKLKELKKTGKNVIIITLFEALMASIIVFLLCLALQVPIAFSLVLAALASATAPASTIMTIKQTKAKGEYVNTLLEVVALDDVVSLVAYSVAISISLALTSDSGINFESVGLPILKNIACLVIGFGLGFLLKYLLPSKRTNDNRLIIVIAIIFAFCGICSLMDQSPLLGCMAMGMVYINISGDDNLFKQLNYFSPPIMLLFFVRSGMNFNLKSFTDMTMLGVVPLFVIALIYFIARIIGKYGGAFTGALVTKSDKKIRNYLGLGLVPQAGVAIGLSFMGARILNAGGSENYGDLLVTIILASSVLYELVGPGLSKLGLYLSKSYTTDINEIVPETSISSDSKQSEVDLLISQIKKIQEENPVEIDENEKAFDEAADEYYEEMYNRHSRKFINRR